MGVAPRPGFPRKAAGQGAKGEIGDTYYIDSVRIGTSFADVIPAAAIVPEPITLLLGAAGLGALGAYVRRGRES